MQGQQPIIVFNQKVEREHGRKAQLANIEAAKNVAALISSTLGPSAMLKMILSPMGGTIMTNDGNAILREIDVVQPAAKHMLEIARAQDEEVGDGTTGVIILAGEMLSLAEPLLERQIHPLKIVKGYTLALTDALKFIDDVSTSIDINDKNQIVEVVRTCLGTKIGSAEDDLMCKLAVEATLRVVKVDETTGEKDIDIKRYAKIEKIPGGSVDDSEVVDGVMFEKDIIHPRMRRRIENPRILLLDSPLEYTKGETAINAELMDAADWEQLQLQEENYIRDLCRKIIALKPDVVVTEKGASELAAHFLSRANISVIRRLRKTDNNRIARAVGATIVSQIDVATESDIGKGADLFEIRKIGDMYFTFITGCAAGSACSIILRGASKDTINEMERNLHDAMSVTRNILLEPRVVYGAGALEMYLSTHLMEKSKTVTGAIQPAYQAVAMTFEVIPRILAQNAAANVIRVVTELRARHLTPKGEVWGIDGKKGTIIDVSKERIIDPAAVKIQAIKTAVEAACIILRVDDVVSGTKVNGGEQSQRQQAPDGNAGEGEGENQ